MSARNQTFRPLAAKEARPSRRIRLWALAVVGGLVVAALLLVGFSNATIIAGAHAYIVSDVAAAPSAAVAIVPGASLNPDGTPTPMMLDRLDTAIRLYRQGKVKSIDLSGYPDEVAFMTGYAKAAGILASALLTDEAGSDTYDTMANARLVFRVQSALVCTQRFHLSRAVCLARYMGIDAIGVPADARAYPGTWFSTNVREWGARAKALLVMYF